MAKSYAKRNYEQIRIESLLAAQEQRRVAVEVVEEKPATMTLDQWFIGLGNASKQLWLAGKITDEEWQTRRQELGNQYRILKAQAAA